MNTEVDIATDVVRDEFYSLSIDNSDTKYMKMEELIRSLSVDEGEEESARKSGVVSNFCAYLPVTREGIIAPAADPNNRTEEEQDAQDHLDANNKSIWSTMAEWESKKHLYGEKIYEDFRKAVDDVFEHAKKCTRIPNNASDELKKKREAEEKRHTELLDKVAIAYRRALVARLKVECKNKYNMEYNDKAPVAFADAMGDLIMSHLSSSTSKLGFWGIVRNVGTLSQILE